ncbi:hypothetical protein [Thioalkalivibrio sp.]|uniref:hypothetical protein n=1 Tax=Thioalkalivibrio sp. TaxID=2093813 RepID=UPI0035616677
MTKRKEVDEAAKKRIAEVFARIPAGESVAPPPALSSGEGPPSGIPGFEGDARRVVEVLGRGGWRAWLIRRLAGI